jgi:hypothetical protein
MKADLCRKEGPDFTNSSKSNEKGNLDKFKLMTRITFELETTNALRSSTFENK